MADSASAGDQGGDTGSRRLRHIATLAIVVAVLVVNLVQQPGLITFDTKLDLQFDPVGFLGRSLGLWNGDSAIGGLQNQASGYLFPMGPAFWLGGVLAVPMWVWERLWSAAVMLIAYEGTRRLAARWPGIGPWGAVVAGLAFMLSPRILQTVGGLSGETLPTAVLPWTVLPLALYLSGRLPARLAFVWSAATVLFMGGQNATLVFACLVLPALLLLLVEGRRWRRRVGDLAAWGSLVVLVSLWWVVPLFLLGGYAPPFLDFIESAQNTASDVGWLTALRGTSHWVAFFPGGGTAGWAGGYAIVSSRLLLVTSVLVAAAGMLGLALSGLWARRALLAAVLLGLVVLTLGTGGWAGSALSDWWLSTLDGPLAPLRNIHKFDPMVRLPLSLGVGAFVTAVIPGLVAKVGSGTPARARLVRRIGVVGVVLAIAAVAVPAASGKLRVQGGMEDISSPWREAVAYLDDQPDPVRAVVLPGTGVAVQTWGRTIDEPIQVLGPPPWVARAQVTVAPAGTLRFLNGIEQQVDDGRPAASLAAALNRLGVTHVVIRNDLELSETDAPDPDTVYSSISDAGLRSVASFGDTASGHPAVEVFEVGTDYADPRVGAVRWSDHRVVQGGPEVIPDLVSAGLLDAGQPSELATSSIEQVDILTDSNRRVERSFGRVHESVSAVMTADQPFRLERAAHDYVGPEIPTALTTAEYEGAADITASSSQGYADIIGPVRPEGTPYAAFDDSALTAWATAPYSSPDGQWIQATFADPVRLDRISLWFDTSTGAKVTSVRITTDGGSITADVGGNGRVVGVELPEGATSSLRITVLATDPGPRQVRLINVDLPGHEIRRSLRLAGAAVPTTTVYLSSEVPERSCVRTEDGTACSQTRATETPETTGFDRTVDVASPTHWRLDGRVVATHGPALDQLLEPLSAKQITALGSSTFGGDPAVAAANAVDGRRDTGWYASPLDSSPVLKLSWKRPRTITHLRAQLDAGQPGELPATLVVDPLTRDKDVQLVSTTGPRAGQMKAVRTDELQISVLASTDLEDGLGISELDIGGANDLKHAPDPDTPTGLLCGFGPTVQVGGRSVQTQVSGTIGDVLSGAELDLEPCAPGDLVGDTPVDAGAQRIRVTNPSGFAVSRLWFTPAYAPGPAAERSGADAPTATVRSWSSTDRAVSVSTTAEAVVSLPESFNRGWTASLDGHDLEPVVVDGWKQAWVVPAGTTGDVRMRFQPQRTFVTSTVVGLALAGVVVLVALVTLVWWSRRRRPPVGALAAERPGSRWEDSTPRRRVGLVVGGLLLCVVSLPLAAGAALGFLSRRATGVAVAVGTIGGLVVAALVAIGAGEVVVPPPVSNALAAVVVGSICGAVAAGHGRPGGTST